MPAKETTITAAEGDTAARQAVALPAGRERDTVLPGDRHDRSHLLG